MWGRTTINLCRPPESGPMVKAGARIRRVHEYSPTIVLMANQGPGNGSSTHYVFRPKGEIFQES
jgi:hypothetical protein